MLRYCHVDAGDDDIKVNDSMLFDSFAATDPDPGPIFERHVGSIIFSREKYLPGREPHVYKAEIFTFYNVSWLSRTLYWQRFYDRFKSSS